MLAKQHSLDPKTIKRIDFYGGRSGYDATVAPPRSALRQARNAENHAVEAREGRPRNSSISGGLATNGGDHT